MTPCAVAINHNGELVVTEHDMDSISIFSPSGEKLQSFGKAGHHPGQFTRPWGVAVDKDGNIIVADRL